MFVYYVQPLVTSESPVLRIWWAMLGHVHSFRQGQWFGCNHSPRYASSSYGSGVTCLLVWKVLTLHRSAKENTGVEAASMVVGCCPPAGDWRDGLR